MTITRASVDSTPAPTVTEIPIPNLAPRGLKPFPPVKHLFDFEVREPYIIGRNAHDIGNGLDIYFEDFEHLVQKDSLNVIETATSENFWNNVNRPELVENEEGLFVCPEEPCIGTFVNNSDLQSHLHIGIHIFSKGNQADYAMKRFKKRLEEMVSDQSTLSRDNVVHIALSQFSGAENVLAHYPRGWALVEEKKTVSVLPKIKKPS
uniref:C2H2-type domain-containing protein n=1 Tax=Panagrolaimus superbus TaxID=310955 RepID=A0A914YGI9_9BILA